MDNRVFAIAFNEGEQTLNFLDETLSKKPVVPTIILVDPFWLPPILNPPSTGEEDNSLKTSTNTDAPKDVSKEALELNDDEHQGDA